MKLTGDRGVDTAIEAVGIPATFELCEEIVAPGGTIANIGVHGTKVDLHLEQAVGSQHHDHDAAGRHRQHADAAQDACGRTRSIPKLLITHRFKLDRILDAYETFGHAAETQALKVIIEARRARGALALGRIRLHGAARRSHYQRHRMGTRGEAPCASAGW